MLRRALLFRDLFWGYRSIVTEPPVVVPGTAIPPVGPPVQLNVEAVLGQVEVERLRDTVNRLAVASRHCTANPDHHAAAARYIRDAFREAGVAVREQSFSYGNLNGRNIIATRRGFQANLRPLLICAHYDSVQNSPGADDNASGVAAMIECARVLAGLNLSRTVELAALDLEEIQSPPGQAGLLGSGSLARAVKRRGKRYAGVYNLEMVGFGAGPGSQRFPPGFARLFPDAYRRVSTREFRGDGIALVGLGRGKLLNRRLASTADRWIPNLEAVSLDVPSWLPIPDLLRSDHTSFWLAGMPATTLTDTGNFRNPHYHGPTDTVETLDFEFLHRVTKLLVATVAEHASLHGPPP